MRLALPVSRSDLHLLPEWVEIHQHLKTAGLNHSLHIVIPRTLESEAQDAKAQMLGLFESITIHPMDFEPYGGWPQAPNMHFWSCAKAMADHNPALPWQLVELDCRPLRANAYDVIASKYASCGSPFFGNIDKTPHRDTEPYTLRPDGTPTTSPNPTYGRITKSPEGDADVMMSGCAVYPGNIFQRDNLAGLMADFMKGGDSPDKAWDMYLRSGMKHEGMAHTPLIAQHWNTENYRVENGRLVGDSRAKHEIFDQHPDWEIRKCGGPVHPDAVMIHGCKDDSLFKLIIGNAIPDTISIAAQTAPVPASVQTPAPQTSAPQPSAESSRIAALEGNMSTMMGMLQQLVSQKNSAGSDGAQREPASASPVSPSAHEAKVAAEPLSILDRIEDAIPQGKSIRIGELEKKTGIKLKQLESAIEGSDKFILKAPGWVQRKAA